MQLQIKVQAGNHTRNNCPVTFSLPKNAPVLKGGFLQQLAMKDENGNAVPVQLEEQGDAYTIHWIVNDLPKGHGRVYTLSSAGETAAAPGVQLKESENKIDIIVGGSYFTSYVYDNSVAKPYLGPVIGPYGDGYTRLDFETKEHPHHRSVWVAIGDVNGVDMWNEPEGVHGKQFHQQFSEVKSGPVLGRLTSRNVWTDFQEKPQVDEERTISIYNTPAEGRFIDMDITFTANYGQVEFGATKEAGPLGIRVAESMKVANGGTMVNAYGALGEEECWGRRAQWCDYSGNVGGHTLGIAVFDNPGNEHYPTYWHIRNYGLFAPNNYYFAGGKLLKPGERARFKYRIYFHDGDTNQAQVSVRHHDYINPPKLELSPAAC